MINFSVDPVVFWFLVVCALGILFALGGLIYSRGLRRGKQFVPPVPMPLTAPIPLQLHPDAAVVQAVDDANQEAFDALYNLNTEREKHAETKKKLAASERLRDKYLKQLKGSQDGERSSL